MIDCYNHVTNDLLLTMIILSLCTGIFPMESGSGRLTLLTHNSIPQDELTLPYTLDM